ncbi:exporter of polyketide antibiotics [Brevibacterium yomogidense]
MVASLTGTGALIWLILRRDRILLALFIALPVLIVASQTTAFQELYPTAEARQIFSQQSNGNPATLGMLGPIFASTLGGLVAWRVGVMGMIFAGIPSLLLVIRHTRAEEESGRRELLSSTTVGRNAPLTAALAAVFGANLALAVAVTIVLMAFGLPTAGSLALGLSFAGAGWMCAAIGGVTAQASESARTARGLSLMAFTVLFLPRIAADAAGQDSDIAWLAWLSPLNWTRLTHPFADEKWWVFTLILGFTTMLGAAAYALSAGRDLDAGFLRPRPGPAQAGPGLRSPLTLAWRLHRRALLSCAVGFALVGGLAGLVAPISTELLSDTQPGGDFLAFAGAGDVGEAFVSLIVYALSVSLVSAYAIMTVLRLRSEETSGHADSLLSGPTPRLRWAWSHLLIAVLGPVVLLAALGLSAGLTYSLVSGDVASELPRTLGSTMAALPAVWVMAALAKAAYGLFPKFAALVGWGTLGMFLLIELGWETQQISDAVFAVSPFSHIHPSTEVGPLTLLSLTAVAAVLAAGGLLGLRRRDFG